MSKKSNTFTDDYDDPIGALAYTDFSKPSPILEGENAERFIRIAEEKERKAAENTKKPMTKEDAKRKLFCSKIIYEFEKSRLKELEKEIKELEEYINKV